MKITLSKYLGIGNRIAINRKYKGYSIEDLADETGLDEAIIKAYENDYVSPVIDYLELIAEALDMILDDLIGFNSDYDSLRSDYLILAGELEKYRQIHQKEKPLIKELSENLSNLKRVNNKL